MCHGDHLGVSHNKVLLHDSVEARAYRAAEGGERACNSRTSCIEGEMLAVTKFKSKSDTLIRVMTLIMPYKA